MAATRFQKLVMREVYEYIGPRGAGPLGDGRAFPAEEYAKMSAKQVDEKWDFEDRHLAHKLARAIVSK